MESGEQKRFRLRSNAVRQLIQTQQLKRWWLAEEVGVHKTTLKRWLSGKIAEVKRNHVMDLARVLQTPWTEVVE